VPLEAVAEWLRQTFERWGLPERIRADNGRPWGNLGELPPPLVLWLWGLGCELIGNRPAHPQENGVVERFHGLIDQWGEPERCADWLAWGDRLAWVVQRQRELDPAINGKSRLSAYPDLEQNPRRYAGEEGEGWQIERVRVRLAQGRWRRQVDQVGRITLYHRPYSVGRAFAGREVWVRFDAASHTWVIEDESGEELRRYVAEAITRERILCFQVSHVKPHRRRPAQHNFPAHVVT
jgi:hypothetical protein